MPEILGSGAEAVLYLDKHVIKDRVRKGYRIPEIDTELRKARTRREAKVLETLAKIGFPAPALITHDRTSIVEMQFIEGVKLRDVLDKSDVRKLGAEIGHLVAMMHNAGIIHGDLTTSNMIINDRIYLIDFGLSYFSTKVEDKAVDMHLLRQALESKHHGVWEECFEAVLEAYRKDAEDDIMKRFMAVEGRGRNKGKSL